MRACLRRNAPGPYQLQAAIAAVHTDAATAADTDWAQIVALYDQLLALQPTDVVELNRAVAIAQLRGPRAGLEALETVGLDGFHLYHATRADLLARLGRRDDALAAYDRAIDLVGNQAERQFLVARRVRGGCGRDLNRRPAPSDARASRRRRARSKPTVRSRRRSSASWWRGWGFVAAMSSAPGFVV